MLRRCKRCVTAAAVPAMERHGCECCLAVAGDGFGPRWLIAQFSEFFWTHGEDDDGDDDGD
eukprot:scaffold9635_cov96-Cyclotella_meneghiniana.AAC.1